MSAKSTTADDGARRTKIPVIGAVAVFLCLVFANVVAHAQEAAATLLKSPNGRLVISFKTVPGNRAAAPGSQLVYEVTFQDKPLIEPSALRLHLKDQRPLGSDVRIAKTTPSKIDQTYRLITGKASTVRDHCNALRLDLEENNNTARKFTVEARAYDDAVAFRYVVPEQTPLREFRLTKEHTEFRVSKDATTYAQILPNFQSQYESEYVKLPITAFANQGGVASTMLIGLPILMEVPGVGWMAITEADVRNYSAMYLVNTSATWSGHWFESRLAPDVDEPELCVSGSLPRHSAWRVLMVADAPGRLIESTVITSLNPETAIADTSWIKPGRSAWDWWSGSLDADGKRAFTTANLKYYTDFAARSGLEYVLVDAGWSPRDDILKMNGTIDIPELVRYAGTKNVKVWIWAHWNAVDRQMDEAFALYEKWGVAGVKIDFMSRDDQKMIAFYYRVAEKAAKHRLMIDFHGSTKPTGMERTYPNVVGYEGVLGMEQSKAGNRDNPDCQLMLPFTRMLAGPMDYTPGGFDNVTREDFQPRMQRPMVMGTRAHHLAMYVVYESPFQMVSDYPGAYEGQPAFEFIKNVPAAWDETRVLAGEPGEFITIARRRGDDWFLGSMTNWTPRQLDASLSFLSSGQYSAEIYADANDATRYPKNVAIDKRTVDRNTQLKMPLAPAGGYAVRLRPMK